MSLNMLQPGGSDSQPFINAYVNVNGQWKTFRAILDSGNDITLMTTQTAQQLGITPQMASGRFKVQFGESKNQGHDFYSVTLPMKLGSQLRPFQATIGVGPARENLIGRKDAFEHHAITFAGGKINISQHTNANSFNVDLGNNREMHSRQNAYSKYREVIPNNYI